MWQLAALKQVYFLCETNWLLWTRQQSPDIRSIFILHAKLPKIVLPFDQNLIQGSCLQT